MAGGLSHTGLQGRATPMGGPAQGPLCACPSSGHSGGTPAVSSSNQGSPRSHARGQKPPPGVARGVARRTVQARPSPFPGRPLTWPLGGGAWALPWESWAVWILFCSGEAFISNSRSHFSQCQALLNKITSVNPQTEIDGLRNIWILKPAAKSRGRGESRGRGRGESRGGAEVSPGGGASPRAQSATCGAGDSGGGGGSGLTGVPATPLFTAHVGSSADELGRSAAGPPARGFSPTSPGRRLRRLPREWGQRESPAGRVPGSARL